MQRDLLKARLAKLPQDLPRVSGEEEEEEDHDDDEEARDTFPASLSPLAPPKSNQLSFKGRSKSAADGRLIHRVYAAQGGGLVGTRIIRPCQRLGTLLQRSKWTLTF